MRDEDGESMIISVASGKGGTGKTLVATNLALSLKDRDRVQLLDCDVEEPNTHPFLRPTYIGSEAVFIPVPKVDEDKCTECGLCHELCRFNAITDFKVDPISCEGCSFCSHVCPAEAITMKENLSGHWFVSDTRYEPLIHAKLGIAQENSGKLVAQVRQQARQLAEKDGVDCIISDGPPGIGCPVIPSLSEASVALLVTEPTLSGIHDL
ncbi:4Fe-4S binding protein [Chloroflexota bacterium]